MSKQQLVLAFFENEAAADEAVEAVKRWNKQSNLIRLKAIGVLVKDENGEIKTHKLGSRRTSTGAVLGALAAVLTGGLTLVGGALLGGILGAFFHKGLGMSKDDLARIDSDLDGGKAAVGILVKPEQAEPVYNLLVALGGVTETHDVSEEALDQAAMAAEEEQGETTEQESDEEGE